MKKLSIRQLQLFAPVFIGTLLHLVLAGLVLSFKNDWLTAQTLFHIPLLLMIYLLFFDNVSFLKFSFISWIAFLFAKFEIIDLQLYLIFSKFDLFPDAFKIAEWVNPQYMKLMVYMIAIPIMVIKISFKKHRSLIRAFNILGAIACCVLTLVLHHYIIRAFLHNNKNINLARMNSAIGFLQNEKSLSEPQNQSFCTNFKLDCRAAMSPEEITQMFAENELSKYSNNQLKQFIEDPKNEKSLVIFSGVSSKKKNAEYTIGVIARKGKYWAYFDKEMSVDTLWYFKSIFIKVSLLAYLVWGWVFLVVGLLHTHYASLRKAKYAQSGN